MQSRPEKIYLVTMCPRVPNVLSVDPVISMEGKLHGLEGPQESYYTIHCNFPYIEDILAVQRARLSQYTVWARRTVLHATVLFWYVHLRYATVTMPFSVLKNAELIS